MEGSNNAAKSTLAHCAGDYLNNCNPELKPQLERALYYGAGSVLALVLSLVAERGLAISQVNAISAIVKELAAYAQQNP